MPDRLAPAWLDHATVQRVVSLLGGAGDDIRFVGGCVRDALLGEDVSDIDIGVPFPPDETVRRLEGAGFRAIPTGIDHGTVTALVDGETFEVTSLRQDVETDGRRAVVAYTSDWQDDALRRDFTINAMSLRPDGRVFDYFEGRTDLASRRTRFVGDPTERIIEDGLRILRFYRFAARFGLAHSDPVSRAACASNATLIRDLSRERIGQEFLKILVAPDAATVLRAMAADGVLHHVVEDTAWDLDRFERMIAAEAALSMTADPLRRLSALVADPSRTETVSKALRLSGKQADHVLSVVQVAPDAAAEFSDPAEQDADAKIWRAAFYRHGAQIWRDAALLAQAALESADNERLARLNQAAVDWERPTLPVRGADLVARGLSGPAIGKGLTFVERWWIANDFQPNREQALDKLEEAVALVRAMTAGPQ